MNWLGIPYPFVENYFPQNSIFSISQIPKLIIKNEVSTVGIIIAVLPSLVSIISIIAVIWYNNKQLKHQSDSFVKAQELQKSMIENDAWIKVVVAESRAWIDEIMELIAEYTTCHQNLANTFTKHETIITRINESSAVGELRKEKNADTESESINSFLSAADDFSRATTKLTLFLDESNDIEKKSLEIIDKINECLPFRKSLEEPVPAIVPARDLYDELNSCVKERITQKRSLIMSKMEKLN